MKLPALFFAFLLTLPLSTFATVENIGVITPRDSGVYPIMKKQVYQLGQTLASQNKVIYYNGATSGISAELFNGVSSKKGKIIAVTNITDQQKDCLFDSTLKAGNTDTPATPDNALLDSVDALIFTPGDFDVIHIFTTYQVLLKEGKTSLKPIVFFNTNHYWDKMENMLTEMTRQGTLSDEVYKTIIFTDRISNIAKLLDKAQSEIKK